MLRSRDKILHIGQSLSRDVLNAETDWLGVTTKRMINLGSPEFGMAALFGVVNTGAAGAWPSANKPIAVPFRLSQPALVYKLGWVNGSGTMTDSFDIGIYDTAWVRKVSGGGTARSGVSAAQWVDVTDTALTPGKYYLVGANNGVTAANVLYPQQAMTAAILALLGCFDSATNAYPLPAPLTNMVAAATFTQVPSMAIACQVPYA